MRVRKNDEVLVISGDDRGKKGKVHRSFPDRGLVLVEGVNMTKRHMKPRPNVRQAGIIEREAPISISNVMVVCSKCKRPSRLGIRKLDDGSRVRVCKECGEVID